jgi:DNA mismatch repair ATPase MutS
VNVDKQTLKNLQIFSSGEAKQSPFELFDKTQTYGSKDKLRTLFACPLRNVDEIREMQEALQ